MSKKQREASDAALRQPQQSPAVDSTEARRAGFAGVDQALDRAALFLNQQLPGRQRDLSPITAYTSTMDSRAAR